jgi:hypothetical protein
METLFEKKISLELRNLKITQTVIKICDNLKGNKYEVLNCIERWVMVLGKYRIIKANEEINHKLVSELLDCERSDHTKLKKEDVIKTVLTLIKTVNKIVSLEVPIKKATPKYDKETKILSYGSFLTFDTHHSINLAKISESSPEDALLILARYSTLVTGGQHFAIPREHYQKLYDLGARVECFASVLNTKALYFKDAKYCSLFPDLEEKYGSLGSFWDLKIEELPLSANDELIILVNPPYIESIINKAMDKVHSHLKKCKESGKKFAAFMMLPHWMDLKSIEWATHNEFLIKYLALNNKSIFFESMDGTARYIKNKNLYVLLSTFNDSKLIDALDNIVKIKPSESTPFNVENFHLINKISFSE